MAELQDLLKEALVGLRKKPEAERKFDQSVDLIVNLQKFEVRKHNVNIFVKVPHKIKDKKIAGFLESVNKNIDTIPKEEFKRYKDKKEIKKLVDKYDFFIAQGSLMPLVASTFGRALGPSGKMPSPQMGIILNADDKTISDLKEKVNKGVKIKIKEASVKVAIGKQSMKDEDIIENALSIYNAILKEMPRDKENIKNVELKFTMTKPIKMNVR